MEADQLVLPLPQHADHQDHLIPQQVDHLILLQDYERPEYQLWNFLFLHKEFYL